MCAYFTNFTNVLKIRGDAFGAAGRRLRGVDGSGRVVVRAPWTGAGMLVPQPKITKIPLTGPARPIPGRLNART